MTLEEILSAFEDALELERELGTRTVEIDRALLRPAEAVVVADKVEKAIPVTVATNPHGANDASGAVGVTDIGEGKGSSGGQLADFAFLLEGDPAGPVAELLPKMSEAIGYGPDGVRINDPSARVLIVLGRDALNKWLPGVLARPGQWVKRGETPALVTASPTKTYRFHGNDPAKIHQLKKRLWEDLQAALARLGKKPPVRRKGA